MQTSKGMLEKDLAVDLLSMDSDTYLRRHRMAQYWELSEAGYYNLRTVDSLNAAVISCPEVDVQHRFPSDHARRYRQVMPKAAQDALADGSTISLIISRSLLSYTRYLRVLLHCSGNAWRPVPVGFLNSLWQYCWRTWFLDSERLFELSIRRIVVKRNDEVVIKVFPESKDLTEYQNIQYLADQASDLPIPRPHGLIALDNLRVIFMLYIPGVALEKVWWTLSHEGKSSIQKELDRIFCRLRSQRQDAGAELGGVCTWRRT